MPFSSLYESRTDKLLVIGATGWAIIGADKKTDALVSAVSMISWEPLSCFSFAGLSSPILSVLMSVPFIYCSNPQEVKQKVNITIRSAIKNDFFISKLSSIYSLLKIYIQRKLNVRIKHNSKEQLSLL